ncbi:MAG: ArsA family ATPase [Oscillochloris sp.]|nr:ArsA family ATPase [Oscillochloris sp.]
MQLLIFSGHTMIQQSAAALSTALHAARRGQRVLIVSTGPNHLTGALLGQNLGPRPLELEPNLAAVEIGPLDEIGNRWEQIRPTLRSGLAARLRDIGSDEIPCFPGIDAVSALLVVTRAIQSNQFDVLIIDGPAPDSLVRAMALSDTMRWLLRLVFGLDRGPGRSRTSQETAIIPSALIPPSTTAPLQDLRAEFEEHRARLNATTGARVRLVATPDELRLPPLRNDLVALGLYGTMIDKIIVPGEPGEVSSELRQLFGPEAGQFRPTLHFGPIATSPADRDTWALRGAALYRDGDIGSSTPFPHVGERELRLAIPFLDAKALDIAMANEEVVIRIGQLRRHVLLPGLSEGGRLRARVEGESLRLWVD